MMKLIEECHKSMGGKVQMINYCGIISKLGIDFGIKLYHNKCSNTE